MLMPLLDPGHSWLWWVIIGGIAGAIAKLLTPGRDPGGLVMTTLIGIVGAIIGGFISTQLGYGAVDRFDVRGILIAVAGAIVLLFALRLVRRRA